MQQRFLASVLLLLLLAAAVPAMAAVCRLPSVPFTPTGYYTGQNLLAEDDHGLGSYIGGFINSFMFSIVIGASVECVDQANKCLGKMSGLDMIRAVRAYVAANPRRSKGWASTLTFNALFSQCFGQEYGEEPPAVPRPTPS